MALLTSLKTKKDRSLLPLNAQKQKYSETEHVGTKENDEAQSVLEQEQQRQTSEPHLTQEEVKEIRPSGQPNCKAGEEEEMVVATGNAEDGSRTVVVVVEEEEEQRSPDSK